MFKVIHNNKKGGLSNALSAISLTVLFLIFPLTAQSTVITWDLNNFIFDDGGTATGFFDWDTVTNTSTNWDILVSGGNTVNFPILNYTDETTSFTTITQGADTLIAFFLGQRQLRIGVTTFDSLDVINPAFIPTPGALQGAGGYMECFNCNPFRFGQTGAFLSSVPEPATLALFALGLVGLGFARRKKA